MSKLCDQIQANLKWNQAFHKFCEGKGVLHVGFYGVEEIYATDEKDVVKEFKAVSKIWYKDSFEAELSMDAMPFGGWKNEKEELTFLRAFRKINSWCNSEVRAFMQGWTGDPAWTF